MTDRPVVVVVGAGLAGLTTAHRLRHPPDESAAVLNPKVIVLEASDRVGGKLHTERFDGFVVEAGADSFLRTKPWGIELVGELGLESELQPTEPSRHRAYIRIGRRLHPLPAGLTGAVPGRLGPILTSSLLSPAGRLRVALEPLVPARSDPGDESVAALIRRRFGKEAFERLVQPLLSGIHGASAELLSAEAIIPALVEAERTSGSVLRGLARETRGTEEPRAPEESRRSPFVSLRGGIDRLARALVDSIGHERVFLNEGVQRVECEDTRWRVVVSGGKVLVADAVVLATPANTTAAMLESLPELSKQLGDIRFGSTAVVSAAFRTGAFTRPPRGHGYLNPASEKRAISACTWSSQKLSGRAPNGFVLVRGFVPEAFLPPAGAASEDGLAELLMTELGEVLGPTVPPEWCRSFRWDKAMPIYEVGHPARIEAVRAEAARHPGLFIAGASYDGVGLPDTIRSAQDAARDVDTFLAAGRQS